jgi:transcriptional regulator with XRE-family HTH domain
MILTNPLHIDTLLTNLMRAGHDPLQKLAELADLSRNFINAVERGENTISVDALG